mgnify:CR=1 FL=1
MTNPTMKQQINRNFDYLLLIEQAIKKSDSTS